MLYEFKITVVKVFEPKDIFSKDFILETREKILKCGFFDERYEFIVPKSGKMPEGFCQHAYHSLYKFIDVLRLGGGYNDWSGKGTFYGVCYDGIRPVCIKIQRIEENKR
ncbi:MAG: TIGR04076 family protein [Candidatus Heimdallarchaeota archaeon]|nr:TIGR04076 family protein [Candidatus Heimdallarchaeota archaeon]